MKNLFFALTFIFATTLSFANNDSNLSTSYESLESDCVPVTFSCGISGYLCGANDSTQLISWVLYYEGEFCG